jgi:hypothetical protein
MTTCTAKVNGLACGEQTSGMQFDDEPRCDFHLHEDMITFLAGADITVYAEVPYAFYRLQPPIQVPEA